MAEATIRDVARLAEVSIASVSRVLNGVGNVSDFTRTRVEDAVKRLGYVPHAGARSLSLARAYALGVMLPDLHGEFFSEIMRGMEREASRRGYLLLLSNMHHHSAQAELALRMMRGRVDGLIVMAPHLSRDEMEAALPPAQPAVLINPAETLATHSSIRVDNASGIRSVVDHLVANGRRRLVHIRGPQENIDADERCLAFLSAVQEHGLADQAIVLEGAFTDQSGETAVAELLDRRHAFDAIVAGNDMMAIGAIQALRNTGLSVWGPVAVTGFDDIPLAKHVDLTTVRVGIAELGARAIARLIDMLDAGSDEIRHDLQAPELVTRASSSQDSPS
jgi:LacI family transcriptional regulator